MTFFQGTFFIKKQRRFHRKIYSPSKPMRFLAQTVYSLSKEASANNLKSGIREANLLKVQELFLGRESKSFRTQFSDRCKTLFYLCHSSKNKTNARQRPVSRLLRHEFYTLLSNAADPNARVWWFRQSFQINTVIQKEDISFKILIDLFLVDDAIMD